MWYVLESLISISNCNLLFSPVIVEVIKSTVVFSHILPFGPLAIDQSEVSYDQSNSRNAVTCYRKFGTPPIDAVFYKLP